MSLLVLTAEYAAALAELGAAALDERAKRAAALGLGVMATSGEHWLDGGAYRPGTESQCLSARAAWRAANVRTEKAVDRLEAATASFLPAATASTMTAGIRSHNSLAPWLHGDVCICVDCETARREQGLRIEAHRKAQRKRK